MSNSAVIDTMSTEELHAKILSLVPQARPFRFVDSLHHVNEESAKGEYTYREDEFFFEGHFPGNPVTPGVILTETMAQIGLVSIGIYHDLLAGKDELPTTFFTDCKVDFLDMVLPKQRVIVESKLNFYRRGKLQAEVELYKEETDGGLVLAASGQLAGIKR